ncbi:MAG: hypothetical protein JOZ10_00240 [Acidobacteria bacterium]|nr:hypothetical protein [Acidobacteriota bacterium]MBV9147865.1 hypothetical protein [Acidobacteriota bacterium]MBV9434574.1 hypothetical protein [Acidobacteriota bacterium]
MQLQVLADDDLVAKYFELFVNRRAYTLQSSVADEEKGRRSYYYRPKGLSLSAATIRSHLQGNITIGLYAISPATQRCKWVAIDADYASALEDLLKLQWELRQDGVEAALEKSRRGGHLWIFAAHPVLARDCRLYVQSLAQRLAVPIKGVQPTHDDASGCMVTVDGIEIFPKQDELAADEFGNAIRGPLGIHRGVGKRFWFYGADYTLEAQISYLSKLKPITEEEIAKFIVNLSASGQLPAAATSRPRKLNFPKHPAHSEFCILEHVAEKKRRSGRNYFTRCPSCAQRGRDRRGDNLAICIVDPRKYRCWAGCTKEDIRAALGCPIPRRRA